MKSSRAKLPRRTTKSDSKSDSKSEDEEEKIKKKGSFLSLRLKAHDFNRTLFGCVECSPCCLSMCETQGPPRHQSIREPYRSHKAMKER